MRKYYTMSRPCFCGSEVMFKKCHKNRKVTGEEFAKYIYQVRADKDQMCLHPSAPLTCTPKILNAHTIQRKGPLKYLIDEDNHLGQMNAFGENDVIRVGWRRASTFRGFCTAHDKEMFQIIEDEKFKGRVEQVLVAGYRAYAFEYYKKMDNLRVLLPYYDYADFEDERLANQLTQMVEGTRYGEGNMRSCLDEYKKGLESKNYEDICSVIIYFTGDLCVAVCGAFAPDFLIDGNRIRPIDSEIQDLSINSLVTEDGHAVVFSWPKENEVCNKFILSIIKYPETEIPSILVEVIFRFIENVFFSIDWYDALSSKQKENIKGLASNGGIRFEDLHALVPSKEKYVNWEITEIDLTPFSRTPNW